MNSSRAFTHSRLTPFTMDTFFIRSSILRAVKNASSLFSGTLIDIGCGYMPYRQIVLSSSTKVRKYIGLDLERNDICESNPDLTWYGMIIPLSDETVNCALATELLEHCPEPEAIMSEIWRVLLPGGVLFFTVPFLWPLHDVPYDQYRYTPFSLERHLKNAGFEKIIIQSMGGWDESMAQMIGLYVRRRPMPFYIRYFLSIMVLPFVYLLLRVAQKYRTTGAFSHMSITDFQENPMITGRWGIAYKPH